MNELCRVNVILAGETEQRSIVGMIDVFYRACGCGGCGCFISKFEFLPVVAVQCRKIHVLSFGLTSTVQQ